MSIRLYVGNLPAELDRQALEKIFNESGDSVSLKVITDRKTGKCRGFGFVTVGSDEVADTVIEKFNGYDFNGAVLKLEKALHAPKVKLKMAPSWKKGLKNQLVQRQNLPQLARLPPPSKRQLRRKNAVTTRKLRVLHRLLAAVLMKHINPIHAGLPILSD